MSWKNYWYANPNTTDRFPPDSFTTMSTASLYISNERLPMPESASMASVASFSPIIFQDDISEYAKKVSKLKAKKLQTENLSEGKPPSKIARGSDGRVKRLLKIEAYDKVSKTKHDCS